MRCWQHDDATLCRKVSGQARTSPKQPIRLAVTHLLTSNATLQPCLYHPNTRWPGAFSSCSTDPRSRPAQNGTTGAAHAFQQCSRKAGPSLIEKGQSQAKSAMA